MFSTVISALNEGFLTTFALFLVTLVGALPLGLLIPVEPVRKSPAALEFKGFSP